MNASTTNINYFQLDLTVRNFYTLLSEALRGKSLSRTIQNILLNNFILTGDILDVGGRDGRSSYYRFIKVASATIDCVDLHYKSERTLNFNLEKNFPIENNRYDTVLCFNTLEHIYNHANTISEMIRVTKRGGKLMGIVPFLTEFHADPNDFYRYTHQTLIQLLSKHNGTTSITAFGVGPFTASANLFSRYLKFKPLVFVTWIAAIFLDKCFAKIHQRQFNYYCGLFFEFKKDS